MLSRVAVSLFVLGDRLERTEHLARVLRVHAELALDRAYSRDDRFWLRLMELVGWELPGHVNRRQAIELLVAGSTGPSLRRLAAEARSAAQSVRPSLSTEVFEQVNGLHWRLYEGSSDGGLHAYLRGVELGVQLISGLVDETMVHDEARDFLRLGKLLQRGAATVRLVTRKAEELEQAGEDALEWAAALRCCSSFEAYRLRFSAPVAPRAVVRFLLCDRVNPRSAGFCVDEARSIVRRIDGPGRWSPAQDHLGELARVVERVDPESLTATPSTVGTEFSRLRIAIEEALRTDYFLPGRPVAPMLGDGHAVQPQQQQA